PASSSTARTGPPEITPVPSAAGFINTLPEPKRPLISCGIVVPTIGTSTRPFFALSIAFLIASGSSSAFPMPKPILPFLSPTTTTAAKRKLRPPFTTLATRLMVTTRSSNSVWFVSLFLAIVTFPSFYIEVHAQVHDVLLLIPTLVYAIHIHRSLKSLVYSIFPPLDLLVLYLLLPLQSHSFQNHYLILFRLN